VTSNLPRTVLWSSFGGGAVAALFWILLGTPLSALQIMSCPPDNDSSEWPTYDVYTSCDPNDGSDGTRSGTNSKKCDDYLVHDSNGTAHEECYQKIRACQNWVFEENKKNVEHNNKLKQCRVRQESPPQTKASKDNQGTSETSGNDAAGSPQPGISKRPAARRQAAAHHGETAAQQKQQPKEPIVASYGAHHGNWGCIAVDGPEKLKIRSWGSASRGAAEQHALKACWYRACRILSCSSKVGSMSASHALWP
jgi:hypothetical protein